LVEALRAFTESVDQALFKVWTMVRRGRIAGRPLPHSVNA